jgi:hypothetical protein
MPRFQMVNDALGNPIVRAQKTSQRHTSAGDVAKNVHKVRTRAGKESNSFRTKTLHLIDFLEGVDVPPGWPHKGLHPLVYLYRYPDGPSAPLAQDLVRQMEAVKLAEQAAPGQEEEGPASLDDLRALLGGGEEEDITSPLVDDSDAGDLIDAGEDAFQRELEKQGEQEAQRVKVVAEKQDPNASEFPCPDPSCEFVSASPIGLRSHVTAKHPEIDANAAAGFGS